MRKRTFDFNSLLNCFYFLYFKPQHLNNNSTYSNSFLSNKWILFFIVAIGTLLRFYHFTDLPYSHDELSALLRCDFPDFNTLIEHGVKTDFHPPGIQIFLFYWIKLVGTTEWLVKLPFAIASVFSIYLIYKIGSKWKNETVGLIAASFLATTQIAIEYGNFARPYSIGLCFTLILFYSLLVLSDYKSENRDSTFWKNWILFIVSGVILTYTHHFSLLVAGLIGFIGLFLINKKNVLYYLLAGAIIILLYLPNLNILLFQLSKGGVGGDDGWLPTPTSSFFGDFLLFIFHFSIPSILAAVGIMLFGFFQSELTKKYFSLLIISIFLFFTPFLIGYFYSIRINPIIQFSVLIFSHFFLYFILFGHLKNLSPIKNVVLVIIICTVNIFSLITARKHFELIESSYYVATIDDLEEYRIKDQEIPAIIDCSWSIRGFYSKKKGYEPKYEKYSEFNESYSIAHYLDSISNNHSQFYLGATSFIPPTVIAEIRARFPELIQQNNYYGGTTYLFGKKNDNRRIISNYSSGKHWSDAKNRLFKKNGKGYFIPDSVEYSSVFEIKIAELNSAYSDKIAMQLNINELESNSDFLIVAEIHSEGELLEWSGSSAKAQQSNGTCTVLAHSINLGKAKELKNATLKIFLWNPNHKTLNFKDFEIYIQPGNPIIYGLTERL